MDQPACTDPRFLTQSFLHVFNSQKDHPLVQLFDITQETHLSYLFDQSGIQESWRFRSLNRARRLSVALIDEKGDLRRDFLKQVTVWIEKEGHLFMPCGENDSAIQEHHLKVLKVLDRDDVIRSLRRFQNPLCHKWAARLVFETLGISSSNSPTDAQIKMAVVCACLTPLRQNVGSCFATAPAILIQKDQMLLLLDDLYQLLSTGLLKRTFGGVEYAIPLSPGTGIGDLKKNLLLKDSSFQPEWCPGLIAALQTAGVLGTHHNMSFGEWGEAASKLIQEHGAGKNQLTVEELIRRILLRKFSLTAEELARGKSLEMAQFKSSRMSMIPDPALARKLRQLSSFQQEERECCSMFKGICDNALLKAWEFTLASFSEVKMEFSRWNLYTSLGLSPLEPGGIGELINRKIEERIAEFNQKLGSYQSQYRQAFDQMRAAESLLRNASSESEARRLMVEYQSRVYHMRTCLEMRDAVYSEGAHYTNLFSFLIQQYDRKFPEYFQEIYDAGMQDFQNDLYDDCPAGFRLVYKHGRTDPSQWTLIYDAEEYLEALLSFFAATEADIGAACDWEGGSDAVLELTSSIVAHLGTKEFLELAIQRMARAHKVPVPQAPLPLLHTLEKKPWAYTSGGTMTTLIKTYFCREKELTSEEKWVENELELLTFILDTLKNLPPNIFDPLLKGQTTGMLMNSPTHAFILLPAQEHFRQGWQSDTFSYTWVRDEIFLPNKKFYADMRLAESEQDHLLQVFCRQLPPLIAHSLSRSFVFSGKILSVIDWRNQVLNLLIARASPKEQQTLSDTLDAFLYRSLPLVQGSEWKTLARRILSDLMNEKVEEILKRFPDVPAPLLTALELREAIMGCYLLAENKMALSFDLHHYVAQHSRFVGAAQPLPLLFADTNWTGNWFGFLVNPGTGRLELWRLSKSLSQGTPMSQWKPWLTGADRKTWTIFTHPYEYEMAPSAFGVKLV